MKERFFVLKHNGFVYMTTASDLFSMKKKRISWASFFLWIESVCSDISQNTEDASKNLKWRF